MDIIRSAFDYESVLRKAGHKSSEQYAGAIIKIAKQLRITTAEQFWADKDSILEKINGNPSLSDSAKSRNRTYVNKYIEYLSKQPCIQPVAVSIKPSSKREQRQMESHSSTIAPFTDALANIDILAATGYTEYDYGFWIEYDSRVADNEKISGLIEFIHEEANCIYYFMRECLLGEDAFFVHPAESLKIILSPEKKTSEYGKPFEYSKLEDLVNRKKAMGAQNISVAEIERIMGGSFTDVKLGEYGNKTITIFYRVLDASDVYAYMSDVTMVLAHEMMHAYHHVIAPKTYNDNTTESKRVKEAIADFFSFYYLISEMGSRNTKPWKSALGTECLFRAKKRYGSWKTKLRYEWPYSYALYFSIADGQIIPVTNVIDIIKYKSDNDLFNKLYYVLHASIKSMDNAYDALLSRQGGVSGNNTLNALGRSYFLTIKADKISSMTEEEVESYFYKGGNLNSFNKKDTLVPIYLIDILNENKNRWMSIEEIQKQLYCDMYDFYGDYYKESFLPNKNTIRRQLHTLYYKESNLYAKKIGTKFLYMASEQVPSGAMVNNDLILNGANNTAVLSVSYLMDFLCANKNSWLSVNGLFESLNSGPYKNNPIADAKKIRRDLNTLVKFKENIYSKTDGHNLFYSYQDWTPKGYYAEESAYEVIDEDDYDDYDE